MHVAGMVAVTEGDEIINMRKPRKEASDDALEALSAVFNQSGRTRIAILRVLSKNVNPMRYQELLNGTISELGEDVAVLTIQNFNYHLKILRTAKLVEQDATERYVISTTGHLMLSAYDQISAKVKAADVWNKPGYVGELSASLSFRDFDHRVLGDELSRHPFFVPVPSGPDSSSFKWRDNDSSFESEIDILKDGTVYVKVIVYEKPVRIEGYSSEDMEKTSSLYDMARSLAKAIYYYIRRTAKRTWPELEDEITIEDSYPINHPIFPPDNEGNMHREAKEEESR
jgi:DNA-binding transcriptional ArsR family regulator